MKRQTFVRYSLIVVGAVLLQLAIFGDLSLAGVHPDVTFLIAASAGIVGGPHRGALVGFVTGILIDPLLPTPLGMTALVLCLLGVLSGLAEETINTHSKMGIAVLCVGCSAAGVALFAVVGELFGLSTLASSDVGRTIGIVASINGALSVGSIVACMWAEANSASSRSVW